MTESNKDSVPYLLFLAALTIVALIVIGWITFGSDRKPSPRDCNAITLKDRDRDCLPSEDRSRD
jgi:hypothetical protein